MSNWISVKDHDPNHKEPVVYCRPNPRAKGKWHVGIAYWTVSHNWHPEMQSEKAPEGFTYWLPLPGPPEE